MRAALAPVPGVQKVDVEFERQLAIVHYARDADRAETAKRAVAALKGEGYNSWDAATETKAPR